MARSVHQITAMINPGFDPRRLAPTPRPRRITITGVAPARGACAPTKALAESSRYAVRDLPVERVRVRP